MQRETSSIDTASRNRTGQEVSHSDPHVGGLSKPLAWSHGVLHPVQFALDAMKRVPTDVSRGGLHLFVRVARSTCEQTQTALFGERMTLPLLHRHIYSSVGP